MQVSVETTSGLERRMTVGLPADTVDGAVEARLAETAKRVRLDGFRPGKVPVSVVRQRFGADVRNEVVGEMMREKFVEAITSEKLQPAGNPQFEAVKNERGADVEFTATFEVYPEVEVADLGAIEVTKQAAEITDEDINEMLESLRKQRVEYKPVERAAQDGDRVNINFVGKLDGEAFEGGTANDQTLVLGSGSMIPGFESGIEGMSAGEEKTIKVTFPAEYRAENLAGKEAEFDIKVNTVEEGVLPEINDEFFKSFGSEETTEESFRAEVRENMEREARNALRNKLKQSVVEALDKANQFDVPGALIHDEIHRLQHQFAQQMSQQQGQQIDPHQLPAELFTEQAKTRVRTGLIFSELAKQLEITASDERVDAYLSDVASVYQDPQSVIDYYKNNAEQLNQVKAVVLEEAIIDAVVEKANVTDESVSYAQAIAPAQPAVEEASEEEKAE
ncbi:trigger factor [Salinibius halmophilus]|uniref:trigger factor n=1 Tax=Salinibius halmophilus TaxID=1853216 RepID=UPI000E674B57|nr:trigger factor [Salinibius halmophilus]